MGGGPKSDDKFYIQKYDVDIRLNKVVDNKKRFESSIQCLGDHPCLALCCCCCTICIVADDAQLIKDNSVILIQAKPKIDELKIILEEQTLELQDLGTTTKEIIEKKTNEYNEVWHTYQILKKEQDEIDKKFIEMQHGNN